MKYLVLVLALLGAPACSALAAAVPVITAIAATIDRMGAELERFDAVAQETFRTYPDIPASVRQGYVQAYDRAQASRLAVVKAAEGAESLGDENLQKALADFRAAYEALAVLMRSNRMLDDQGRLMVGGQLLEGPAATPSSEFRAE